MYPDLIKVKVALDDGEILGIETTGYLNSHTERELVSEEISIEEARENINENLEIEKKKLIENYKKEISKIKERRMADVSDGSLGRALRNGIRGALK